MTTRLPPGLPRVQLKIDCADGLGRPRTVASYLHHVGDRIVLLAPPGEAALLTPPAARQLADQLQQQATAIDAWEARVLPFVRR